MSLQSIMHQLWKIVPNKGLVDQMTVAIGSIYLSIDLSLSTSLSVCLSVCLSIYLPIYLSHLSYLSISFHIYPMYPIYPIYPIYPTLPGQKLFLLGFPTLFSHRRLPKNFLLKRFLLGSTDQIRNLWKNFNLTRLVNSIHRAGHAK